MKYEGLDPEQYQCNQESDTSCSENQALSPQCAGYFKYRATKDSQYKGQSKPRDWNSRDFRVTAIQYLFTAMGDVAGNRALSAFDRYVECVHHSEKCGERNDEDLLVHFAEK